MAAVPASLSPPGSPQSATLRRKDTTAPRGRAAGKNAGRLLFVEDADDFRCATTRRLQREGFEVVEAAGGPTALDLVARQTFDLVLLDIVMPDLSGFDVLAGIRAQHAPSSLPVIMVTGKTESANIVRALELGANDYVTKPLDFPVALARVRTHISLKRAQDALQEAVAATEAANRAKSTFLAHISHELRTPLNPILGFAEIIRDEVLGPVGNPSYAEYAGIIRDTAAHLRDLLGDLIDTAQIEVGEIKLRLESLDVADVTRRAVTMLLPRAHAAEIAVELVLPDDLPRLTADPLRLRQIIVNLLSNAIKYSRPGSCARVCWRCDPVEGLVLSVEDEGIGMTPAEIEIAFKPFRQIESAYIRGREGVGLGLAITRSLIERHGGTIEITSAPRQGTTVEVTFPL